MPAPLYMKSPSPRVALDALPGAGGGPKLAGQKSQGPWQPLGLTWKGHEFS